ncbi:MAG: lytic transglycosylase domain-containing protein [Sulfitobacter sp.]
MIRGAALAVMLCGGAQADGWARFYVPSPRPAAAAAPAARSAAAQTRGSDTGVCIREILAAQSRHGIPNNLLLAIGLQEAGTKRNGHFTVWPYAVNAAGTGRLFDTRAAALNWVAERQSAGVDSIDVGCMQINLRWHPDAFASAAEGFDPRSNVDYAARFLKNLYRRTGSWMTAAGSYHSFNPEFRAIYLAKLEKNITAANGRLPEFAALASGAPAPRGAAPVSRPPTERPKGGVIMRATWGAHLGGEENARRSLYSSREMQPVLPQFTTITSEPAG